MAPFEILYHATKADKLSQWLKDIDSSKKANFFLTFNKMRKYKLPMIYTCKLVHAEFGKKKAVSIMVDHGQVW